MGVDNDSSEDVFYNPKAYLSQVAQIYNVAFTSLFDDHSLEEAETNLVAKQEANALLNSQVDLLSKQLQELQAGKEAYEKHFKHLAGLLAKERREHLGNSKQACFVC